MNVKDLRHCSQYTLLSDLYVTGGTRSDVHTCKLAIGVCLSLHKFCILLPGEAMISRQLPLEVRICIYKLLRLYIHTVAS